MKVCVYAIAKNESKFVKRWVNSMREADEITVLDTGSDDDTVRLLKECGVRVESAVLHPFRFDVARNLSMDMVAEDADICVCTDLDEVFVPGWRARYGKGVARRRQDSQVQIYLGAFRTTAAKAMYSG